MFFLSSLTRSFQGILLMNPLLMKISFTFLVQEHNIHCMFQPCSRKNPFQNLYVISAWGRVYFLCGILCHICGISTSHCSFYIPSGAKLICIDMELEIRTLMRIMSRSRLLRGLRRREYINVMCSNLSNCRTSILGDNATTYLHSVSVNLSVCILHQRNRESIVNAAHPMR
jgi:hypothetical protein